MLGLGVACKQGAEQVSLSAGWEANDLFWKGVIHHLATLGSKLLSCYTWLKGGGAGAWRGDGCQLASPAKWSQVTGLADLLRKSRPGGLMALSQYKTAPSCGLFLDWVTSELLLQKHQGK